ncbi:hypothetical protein SAMN04488134_11345 [Amphibacillus marinus]|uniref:Uncharacterized protein n=1 Tax=Amphibacillus marinus TaxID=872970 RepID=A0A1H8SMI4_9BACI|nr:hypothetical protein [Amphibacillus marinus]SEO80010.1 hypothetical protein SAMN04488134_11345 [Amphibacillus marinus]
MNQTLAEKIQSDSRVLKRFSKLLLKTVQQKYLNEDFSDIEYSQIINLMTVIDHKTREIEFEVSSYFNNYDRRYCVYYPQIDKRV